jgi:hypothetical protein
MEPLRATTAIVSAPYVQERQGGQRQREAFRQALQQQGGGAEQPVESPLRRRLQPQPPVSRREAGGTHHVDVIA